MYYTFHGSQTLQRQGRRIDIFTLSGSIDFMEEAYDDAFEYDWTRRGEKLLEDQTAQYASHKFPLAVVGKSGWALANWVQGYERYWHEKGTEARNNDDSQAEAAAHRHVKNAKAFGEQLKGITEQYQIAYIELDRDLELDKICDIFTQINSRGIRLDVFDLINACSSRRVFGSSTYGARPSPRLDFVETDRMNVYVLQVMSILCQGYCSPKYLYYLLPGQEKKVREQGGALRKEVLIQDTADFEKSWRGAVTALERAITLLRHPQEFGAIASRYLPYVSILPAFAALQTAARELPPNRQLDAQRKIRLWYWAQHLSPTVTRVR